MMELSNPKILIASDGDKTYVIVNGLPIRCEEFKFYADGCDVSFSIEKAHAGNLFTWKQFLDFIENNLGYKLCAE